MIVPTQRTPLWETTAAHIKDAQVSDRADVVRAAIASGGLFEFGEAGLEEVR